MLDFPKKAFYDGAMKFVFGLLAVLALAPAVCGQVRYGPVAEKLELPKDPMFSKRMKETQAIPLLPGNSLANGAAMGGLRRDVAAGILQLERQQGNTGSTVVEAKVEQKPAGKELTAATWTETWVAQRRAKKVAYQVVFTGQGKEKGITYSIRPRT